MSLVCGIAIGTTLFMCLIVRAGNTRTKQREYRRYRHRGESYCDFVRRYNFD